MVVEVSWEDRMIGIKNFHLDQLQKGAALFGLVGILHFPNQRSHDYFTRQWHRTEESFEQFHLAFETETRSRNGCYRLKNLGLQFQAILIPFLNSCRDMANIRAPVDLSMEDEIEAVSGELGSMELGV